MTLFETSLAVLLVFSLALVFYTYVGYAAVIWCCSRLFGGHSSPPTPTDEDLPTVSLLIAAHDEEDVIGARIENALELDYPPGKLEIVVGSDGSTDRTAEIVRGYAERGVKLFDYPVRRGKASVLNDSVPRLQGDIVLLSDANTHSQPQAVRMLARWFQDPAVGAVCGQLTLVDPKTGRNVDGAYWKYENFLKRCEGRLGALLGANGAIYAIRRSLFVPIPRETIIDDFVIPLLAKQTHGCEIVYDRQAVAVEETPPKMGAEFRRRCRIGAGGFQSIKLVGGLLSPMFGWLSFCFWSHKVLRWCCPFFLVTALVANLLLDAEIYRATLAAQSSFYALSALGAYLPGTGRGMRLVRMTTMFSLMNLALLVGFWRWATSAQRGTWQRTAR